MGEKGGKEIMWGRINMKVRGREGGDKDLQRVDKGKEERKI